MTTEPGLRERKKQATRQAISSAALRLAAERGPDAVTVEAIAEAADVSPRTVFNYFATKDDAILGVDPERPAEVRRAMADRPAGEPPLEALHRTLLAASASLTERAEDWSVRTRLVREHPGLFPRHVAQYAALERGLVEAVAERCGLDADRDLYPSLVVAAALAAMRVAVDRWHATDRAVPVEDLIAGAFGLLAAGLTPPVPALAR